MSIKLLTYGHNYHLSKLMARRSVIAISSL